MTASPTVVPSTARAWRWPLARTAAAALMGVVFVFQLALVAGAPWGAAAFGGQHHGVLPTQFRATSVVSAMVYLALIVVTLRPRPARWRRIVLFVWFGILVLGVAMNLVSRSSIERAIWAPVSLLIAISVFVTARDKGPASS